MKNAQLLSLSSEALLALSCIESEDIPIPLHEFKCINNHVTEKLFLSLSEATITDLIHCPECKEVATKITSAGAFILGGSPGGWEKPSPTAKRVVNPDSVSFTGDKDYFK
jgi:hypothetical protein